MGCGEMRQVQTLAMAGSFYTSRMEQQGKERGGDARAQKLRLHRDGCPKRSGSIGKYS